MAQEAAQVERAKAENDEKERELASLDTQQQHLMKEKEELKRKFQETRDTNVSTCHVLFVCLHTVCEIV